MLLPYEDTFENALYERAVDLARNAKVFTFSTLIPNGGRQSLRLRIPAGGSFMTYGVMGRAIGPVNAAGVRAGVTSFPMAGSAAVGPGAPMADRGVYFKLDLANGRRLTNDKRQFNSLENVVGAGSMTSAGYGESESYAPQPWRYYLAEGDMLILDLENRDQGGVGDVDYFHRFDLLLIGERHVR